jgi:hypothetical protein
LALKYHPDKNKNSKESTEKFKEIQSAYEFLIIHYNEHENVNTNKYETIFKDFVSSLFESSDQSSLLVSIFLNFTKYYNVDSSCFELIEKLDNESAILMYNILLQYKETFLFSEEFLNKLKEIINKKIKDNILITLNPTLDDLFNDNVYIIKEQDKIFYVPLWHHELQYKLNDKNDLIVLCKPEVEKNVEISENNDIIIQISSSINDVLKNGYIKYKISNQEFIIESKNLMILKYQHYIFENRGISRINNNNYYENSNKSDVIFIIELIE